MGVVERRAREKSETRDKILDAARELFITHGYEGVSMRKVAEKIEYSPTAIYVHFADKEDLFHQLCQEDFARLAEVFQSAAAPSDPVERMQEDRTALRGVRHSLSQSLQADVYDGASSRRTGRGRPRNEGQSGGRCLCFPEDTRCSRRSTLERFARTSPTRILISQTLWAAMHGVISLQIAKCNDRLGGLASHGGARRGDAGRDSARAVKPGEEEK